MTVEFGFLGDGMLVQEETLSPAFPTAIVAVVHQLNQPYLLVPDGKNADREVVPVSVASCRMCLIVGHIRLARREVHHVRDARAIRTT